MKNSLSESAHVDESSELSTRTRSASLPTKMLRRGLQRSMLISVILFTLVLPLTVLETAQATTTTADVSIPVDQLRVLLRPMSKEEISVEGLAWLMLLQAKISQVSQTELELIALGEQAAVKEEDALKEKLLALRVEEATLFKRARVVITATKAKGGDVEIAEQYMAAVSDLSNSADMTSRLAALLAMAQSWLTSADGGRLFLWRVIKACIILLVFWLLSRYAGRVVERAIGQRKEISSLLSNFAQRSAGGLTLLIGLFMAIAAAGVEVGPLMAAMGAGGFIVGFAMQETLGNFASGLMIMVYRPFDVDDYVSLAGVEGKVMEMSLVSTTLLTLDNKVLVLPNRTAWSGTITNHSGRKVRRVDLVFGISYDDNIPHAMKVLNEVAAAHELVLKKPALSINVVELGDSSVNIACRPWVKTSDYWKVFWELTERVKMRFDDEGISIPYPQRDVHVHTAEIGTGDT